jgi:hypothetical protein
VIALGSIPWRLRLPRKAIGTALRTVIGLAGLALLIALALP